MNAVGHPIRSFRALSRRGKLLVVSPVALVAVGVAVASLVLRAEIDGSGRIYGTRDLMWVQGSVTLEQVSDDTDSRNSCNAEITKAGVLVLTFDGAHNVWCDVSADVEAEEVNGEDHYIAGVTFDSDAVAAEITHGCGLQIGGETSDGTAAPLKRNVTVRFTLDDQPTVSYEAGPQAQLFADHQAGRGDGDCLTALPAS